MKEIMEHKNIVHILIILILYAVIILLLNKIGVFNKDKIKLVDNYSIFYTTSNSANLYLNYLANDDSKSIISLLDEEYIENNNITKENVIDKLKDFTIEFPTLRVVSMYEEKINNNKKRYYLKGNLIDSDEDKYEIVKDYFLIVDIDSSNNTYTITPYNGKIFKEENNE